MGSTSPLILLIMSLVLASTLALSDPGTLNSSLMVGANWRSDRDCPGIGGTLIACVMSTSDFCDSAGTAKSPN